MQTYPITNPKKITAHEFKAYLIMMKWERDYTWGSFTWINPDHTMTIRFREPLGTASLCVGSDCIIKSFDKILEILCQNS